MKKKKFKLFIILLFGLRLTTVQAQLAIATSGGNTSNSSGSVSYSVGQMVFKTNFTSSGSLAQGVQQPYEVSILNASCDLNYWTGAISAAWENPNNWSCGSIPGANTIVRIDATKPNYPVISSFAVCKTLYNNSGTSIRVKAGYKLNIVGL